MSSMESTPARHLSFTFVALDNTKNCDFLLYLQYMLGLTHTCRSHT